MNAFADGDDIHNLQVAQIGFGGDVFLQPGSHWLAEEISEGGEEDGNRDQPDTPKGGFGSSKRHPGKGPGKKRCGRHVGPASGVDGESAFTGYESRLRFRGRLRNIFLFEIAKEEESRGVGMSAHGLLRIFARQNLKCGMFERMVSAGFEYEGKV